MRTFHHPAGDVEVYLEPHHVPPRLVVVSATDVARSLRVEMERQGRRVIVLEPRAERVAPDDGPSVRSLEELTLGYDDEVVFTDHDAPGIADMLTALLRSPVRFIGDGFPPPRRALTSTISDVAGSETTISVDPEPPRARPWWSLAEDIALRSPRAWCAADARPRGRVADRRRRRRTSTPEEPASMGGGRLCVPGARNRFAAQTMGRPGWGTYDVPEDEIMRRDVAAVAVLDSVVGCQSGIKVATRGG